MTLPLAANSNTLSRDLKSNLLLQARLARRTLRRRRASRRYSSLTLEATPVLFANSFPKSGTHLLTQVLKGFTRIGPAVDSGLPAAVTFEGDTGRQRSADEIVHDLERLLPGDIGYGHVHALPEVVAILCQDGVAAYFILRDPRDVVVSHVHYLTGMKADHIHHRYYQDELQNFDQRLQASIEGVAGMLPNIWERFEPYMDWLDHAEVLVLRFEDFILERGNTIGKVFDHAVDRGFRATCSREASLELLESSIDPARSPTFRSGKIGGWRDSFNEQHKRLFKEVTSDLLIRLGYERDNDW
jgi:hypothetical protein